MARILTTGAAGVVVGLLAFCAVQAAAEMERYYHYTTKEAAEMIKDSGIIKYSKASADPLHGKAVYFTTLDPKTDPGELIKNNWGPQKQDNEENQKKIAWFVKIGMPTDVVIDRRSESDRRDIYTYSEEYENVKLSEYNHEICKNTNPGLIALPESEQNEKICLSSAHAHSLAAMLSPLILVVSFFQVI